MAPPLATIIERSLRDIVYLAYNNNPSARVDRNTTALVPRQPRAAAKATIVVTCQTGYEHALDTLWAIRRVQYCTQSCRPGQGELRFVHQFRR